MRAIAAMLFCLSFVLLLPDPAQAGAWLRKRGEGFIASASTYRWSLAQRGVRSSNTGIYAEYGLLDRLTIGFDGYYDLRFSGHAMLFARVALPVGREPMRYALDFAAGGYQSGRIRAPMAKLTFGLGRGFETRFGNGWLSADAALELRSGQPHPIWKLDATVGLRPSDRFLTMLSIETAVIGPSAFYALIPSVGMRVGKNRTLLAGVELKDAGGRSVGVKLSLWQEF